MGWFAPFLRRLRANRRSAVRNAERSQFVVEGIGKRDLTILVEASGGSAQDFCEAYRGQHLQVSQSEVAPEEAGRLPERTSEPALRIWNGPARRSRAGSDGGSASVVLKTQPHVDMVASLPGSYEAYLTSSIGKILRADIKKARNQGWEIEQTRDAAQYENFYETVYVPYTVKVHGAQGNIPPLEQFLNQGKRLSLLQVRKDGATLGGTFLLSSSGHRQLRNWRMGVAPVCWQDPKLNSQVVIALNSRVVELAIEQGYREASFGLSPGVLNHGNTFMKLKWGCSPRPADGPFYFAEVVGPAGWNFLRSKPLVHFRGNEVVGILALQGEVGISPAEICDSINRLASSGLAEIVVWMNREAAGLVEELRHWPHWSNICCPVRFEYRMEDLSL